MSFWNIFSKFAVSDTGATIQKVSDTTSISSDGRFSAFFATIRRRAHGIPTKLGMDRIFGHLLLCRTRAVQDQRGNFQATPNADSNSGTSALSARHTLTHSTREPSRACRLSTLAMIRAARMGGNLNSPVPMAGTASERIPLALAKTIMESSAFSR